MRSLPAMSVTRLFKLIIETIRGSGSHSVGQWKAPRMQGEGRLQRTDGDAGY